MLDVFLIALITVIIVDLSGFVYNLKGWLRSIVSGGMMRSGDYSLKPIDCSFCMNFWCSLIYVLITGNLSLFILFWILLMSFLTPVIKDLLLFVKDIMIIIIEKLYEAVK